MLYSDYKLFSMVMDCPVLRSLKTVRQQNGKFMNRILWVIASVVFSLSLMQYFSDRNTTITLVVPEIEADQVVAFSMEMPYSPEDGSPRVRYEFPTLSKGDDQPIAIPSIKWVVRDDEMFIRIDTTVGYQKGQKRVGVLQNSSRASSQLQVI